jgi:nicotinate-nucleotide pyrophosphorylase (carboxylating)
VLLPPDPAEVARVVELALREDVGTGDVTTDALVESDASSSAELLLKAAGVLAGLDIAVSVMRHLSPEVTVEWFAADGDRVPASTVVARVEGPTWALLTGERTALNLLGRLSGIATLTRAYVDAVAGTPALILDTRKTTPGLRALEKYAVRCGGGTNHRRGLDDAILIKDNHIRAAGGVGSAIARARRARPGWPVEIEAESLGQVSECLAAGADRILLDNMSRVDLWRILDNMSRVDLWRAVALVAGRCPLEASGGVTLTTVRAIALTGVDAISVGALTHSAAALDVSLEVLP